MMNAYFDNSVFNILRLDTSKSLLVKIQNLVHGGRLQILLSPVNMCEMLSAEYADTRMQLNRCVRSLNPKILHEPNELAVVFYAQQLEAKMPGVFDPIKLNCLAPQDNQWVKIWNANDFASEKQSLESGSFCLKSKKGAILRQYQYAVFYIRLLRELVKPENYNSLKKDSLSNYTDDPGFQADIVRLSDEVKKIADLDQLKIIINAHDKTNDRDTYDALLVIQNDLVKLELLQQRGACLKDLGFVQDLERYRLKGSSKITTKEIVQKISDDNILPNPGFWLLPAAWLPVLTTIALLEGRRPDVAEGDCFDWDQVIYLAVVDIYLFRDGFFNETRKKADMVIPGKLIENVRSRVELETVIDGI